MTTSPKEDRPVLDIDPRWCWSRLRSIREGILVFSWSGRPMTLAVAYAIDGQVRDLSEPLGVDGAVEIITRVLRARASAIAGTL